jgi:hypothetical protein
MISQELIVTTGVLAASAAGVATLAAKERRPRESLKTSMIPTTPFLLVIAFVGLLALIHLMSLLGLVTGK